MHLQILCQIAIVHLPLANPYINTQRVDFRLVKKATESARESSGRNGTTPLGMKFSPGHPALEIHTYALG